MNIRNSLIGLILAVLGVVAAHGGAGQNDSSVESETLFNPSLSYAQVQFATAVQLSDGRWRFDVTLLHNDEGWEHYANAWQVIDPDSGKILGERILAHPHDNEQPFSRKPGGDPYSGRIWDGRGPRYMQCPRIRRQEGARGSVRERRGAIPGTAAATIAQDGSAGPNNLKILIDN